MTNQEAIKILKDDYGWCDPHCNANCDTCINTADELAIKALEQADKHDEHLKRIAKSFCEKMTDCFVCPAAGDPHCFDSNKFYEWMKEVE